jgi:multiple sugar transport system substrate-binding protein
MEQNHDGEPGGRGKVPLLHTARRAWVGYTAISLLLVALYLIPYMLFRRQTPQGVTEIYFADRITEAHRLLIDRYNALHAGQVKVVPIDFPNEEFSTNERKEILARSLRGEGDGIDLLAVDVIWVQRFAKWCEPLDSYFTEAELQRITPDALYSCYSDGRLYAVPLDMVQVVMYYREDLLRSLKGGEKAIRELQRSMTWSDFLQLRTTLGWKRPFYIYPAADYEGLICSYIEVLLSLQPDYFSTVGFNFDTPKGQEALQLLVDLIQKYGATPPVSTTFTEVPSYVYFMNHNGLFLRGWVTYDHDFKGEPYDTVKQKYLRVAPIPHPADGRPTSMFGGWDLMISRFSRNKEAVVDFLKYLLRDDSQEAFYVHSGYYPVVTSFYESPKSLRKFPEIAQIKELMRTGVHRPANKEYTNFSKIMSHYFSLAIKRKMSVREATRSATRAIRLSVPVGETQ